MTKNIYFIILSSSQKSTLYHIFILSEICLLLFCFVYGFFFHNTTCYSCYLQVYHNKKYVTYFQEFLGFRTLNRKTKTLKASGFYDCILITYGFRKYGTVCSRIRHTLWFCIPLNIFTFFSFINKFVRVDFVPRTYFQK